MWAQKFSDYKVDILNIKCKKKWKKVFISLDLENVVEKINVQLSLLLKKTKGEIEILPYPRQLFYTFKLTSIDDLRVVIIGQDPYFNTVFVNGETVPQATGLAFSVNNDVHLPPSLNNIIDNLIRFKHIKKKPKNGDLTKWTEQGCLLLNTALTVQKGHANSHKNMWIAFTDYIIKYISDKKSGLIFLIWGGNALDKLKLIDLDKHYVSISSHPSPNSLHNTLNKYSSFYDCDHFGYVNKQLNELGENEIDWNLTTH
jgi:uracil-DNA glycosylase